MDQNSTYSINLKDIEADISKCDNNIGQARKVIEDATSYITSQEIEKEKLLNIKNYIFKRSIQIPKPPPKTKTDLFSSLVTQRKELKKGKEYGEMTAFIKDYIKEKKVATTKEITQAYSDHSGEPIESLDKNISRTLGRLKVNKIIDNPGKEGSQRGGRTWYYQLSE